MRLCVFIVGTRAQLVKVAPVLRLAKETELPHVVWFTGQHSESIDDLIQDFQLGSEVVMPQRRRERSSFGKIARWLPGSILDCHRYVTSCRDSRKISPLVIVHGDTLSTLMGAVAGKLARADVVHLESGLSSFNLLDPFPEEILRRITFRLTRYALCPNGNASRIMRRFQRCEVVDTGDNTLLDCVRYAVRINGGLQQRSSRTYFVASIHRFENIYRHARLAEIVNDIILAAAYSDIHFVLHPPTERRLQKSGLLSSLRRARGVILEQRMPYTRFLALLAEARAVFSDGGSNQEELSYLGVPSVLFRRRSERPDGLGANIVLRDEINPSIGSFIDSGELDRLRRPCRLNDSTEPSRTAVQALARWADSLPT